LENWFRKQAGMPIKEIDKLNEDLTSATDEDEANTDEDDKISDPRQTDIEAVKPQVKPEPGAELKPTEKPTQPDATNQDLPLQEPIKRKKQIAEKKSVVKKIMKFLGLK
jgi:DNA-binding transcriptional MerR regulator